MFVKLKSGTEYLNYGRHIIESWAVSHILKVTMGSSSKSASLLDLGCGHAHDLLNIKKNISSNESIELNLSGIENYSEYVKECRSAGINIFQLDIERDYFPKSDGGFDLVIANQLLEHTKEIFWIFNEVSRILKPGGQFLIGVPNLASLHNRILLLFGEQPTAQQSFSAHVRGFTRPDLKRFSETGGFFKMTGSAGSNFYPLPPALSRPLSNVFPSLAWGLFVRLERTTKKGSFLECLTTDENMLETPFYGGPLNPPPR